MNQFKKLRRKWREEHPFLMDIIESFIVASIVVFVTTTWFLYPVHVEGTSMYPTLHDLDVGFSNLFSYRTEGLQRFDVVIVHYKPMNEYLIKRVIGLPGDLVQVKDDVLYINGEAMEEPFLDTEYANAYRATYGKFTDDFGPFLVPANEIFVMGDNRRPGGSTDSRVFGTLPLENVRSKDVYILWPPSHFIWETGTK